MTATDEATTAPSSVEPGDSRIVERSLLRFKGEDMESSLSKIERFDDQIMGGISQSTIIRGTAQSGSFTEDVDCGVFGGVVRPQGGGFAGCRTKILQKPLDLSGNTGIYLKVAGDGKIYKVNMRGSATSNEMVYQAEFNPPVRDPSCSSAAAAFSTVRIPFSCFRLVKRSVPVPNSPPLPVNSIYQMGLVMSKFSFGEDQFNPTFQPGLFRLEIQEIGVYLDPSQASSFVDSSSNVRQADPLPLNPDDMIQDSLRFKATGKKRSWFSRVLLQRVRKVLKKRVASKRTAIAQELLEARKQGKRLSEWRREAQ